MQHQKRLANIAPQSDLKPLGIYRHEPAAATVRHALSHRHNHLPLFPGTRDLAGSRQGALGRSELDLDFEPAQRRPLPPLGDPFFDDEETVFDIHGQRTSRPRRLLGGDFASEVAATTNRLKSRLHLTSESIDEKLSESTRGARAALGEAEAAFRRRPRFGPGEDAELLDELKPSMTKWSKLAEADEAADEFSSAAAGRARRSKARLNDLEAEMEEIAEKQARRERRTAALRALVNETSSAADESLASATKISSKSVHRSEKSEKHVSF